MVNSPQQSKFNLNKVIKRSKAVKSSTCSVAGLENAQTNRTQKGEVRRIKEAEIPKALIGD